jgi:hypothetical protein
MERKNNDFQIPKAQLFQMLMLGSHMAPGIYRHLFSTPGL